MPSAKPERDLVLFLGAGFSADAGLPVMRTFGEKSEQVHKDCKSKQDRRKLGPTFVDAGCVFAEFQRICNKATNFVAADTVNMETVFCMAEARCHAQSCNKASHVLTCNGTPYNAREVVDQIQLWLCKVYQGNPLEPGWRKTPYAEFAKTLKDNDLGPRLTVLTTNYDLVFESFAWRVGLSCKYGIANSERVRIGERDESYLVDDSDDAAPLMCKVHGSINYFHEPEPPHDAPLQICDDVMKQGDLVTNSPNITVIHGGTERPYVLASDAVAMLRESNNGREFVTAVVPPTYAKLQEHQWLRSIWNNAVEALKSARKVIFIGYSMPESDGHLRAMIQSAMAERTLSEPPAVYVFDPSPEALIRYRDFFAPLKLKPAEHLWGMDMATACQSKLPEVLTN